MVSDSMGRMRQLYNLLEYLVVHRGENVSQSTLIDTPVSYTHLDVYKRQGVGIDIHEEPRFSPGYMGEIPENVVISVEPGIYLPDEFGVRIEDLVVVKPDGVEDLTHSPKKIIVL